MNDLVHIEGLGWIHPDILAILGKEFFSIPFSFTDEACKQIGQLFLNYCCGIEYKLDLETLKECRIYYRLHYIRDYHSFYNNNSSGKCISKDQNLSLEAMQNCRDKLNKLDDLLDELNGEEGLSHVEANLKYMLEHKYARKENFNALVKRVTEKLKTVCPLLFSKFNDIDLENPLEVLKKFNEEVLLYYKMKMTTLLTLFQYDFSYHLSQLKLFSGLILPNQLKEEIASFFRGENNTLQHAKYNIGADMFLIFSAVKGEIEAAQYEFNELNHLMRKRQVEALVNDNGYSVENFHNAKEELSQTLDTALQAIEALEECRRIFKEMHKLVLSYQFDTFGQFLREIIREMKRQYVAHQISENKYWLIAKQAELEEETVPEQKAPINWFSRKRPSVEEESLSSTTAGFQAESPSKRIKCK